MTMREFFLQTHKAEFPAFQRVLRALPQDRLDYKPHERSPSAQQLMWTLTFELQACLDVITKRQAEWQHVPPPPYDQMLATFERLSKELDEQVARLDEAAWSQPARFLVGGKVVNEQPVGQFLWFVLRDAIHHRGQLSAYLRPMGGKVPAIYGPSADEPGM